MKKFVAFALICSLCTPAFAAILTPADNRKVVTTATTAVPLVAASTPFVTANICAETDNTGIIVIGASTVVAAIATRRGVPLNAGDCITYAKDSVGNINDLALIYIDSTVNGDGVTFEYRT